MCHILSLKTQNSLLEFRLSALPFSVFIPLQPVPSFDQFRIMTQDGPPRLVNLNDVFRFSLLPFTPGLLPAPSESRFLFSESQNSNLFPFANSPAARPTVGSDLFSCLPFARGCRYLYALRDSHKALEFPDAFGNPSALFFP